MPRGQPFGILPSAQSIRTHTRQLDLSCCHMAAVFSRAHSICMKHILVARVASRPDEGCLMYTMYVKTRDIQYTVLRAVARCLALYR
jgi:hypothetical protein